MASGRCVLVCWLSRNGSTDSRAQSSPRWSAAWQWGQIMPIPDEVARTVVAMRDGFNVFHGIVVSDAAWRQKIRSYSNQPVPPWRWASWSTMHPYARISRNFGSRHWILAYISQQRAHWDGELISRIRAVDARVSHGVATTGEGCSSSSRWDRATLFAGTPSLRRMPLLGPLPPVSLGWAATRGLTSLMV